MSRHYQSLAGAAVLATEDLLDARDLIGDISDAVAMGAIYGPAGTGKSFAVDEAIADRAEPDHVRTDFRARPTMRYVRQELGRLLGVGATSSAFDADWALKRALSERFRLVIIDEAQWLNRECFEYLRHLHDDPTPPSLCCSSGATAATRCFAGNRCWTPGCMPITGSRR